LEHVFINIYVYRLVPGVGSILCDLALAMQYGLFCDHGLIQYQVTGLAFST
jgi:hypothetical protein